MKIKRSIWITLAILLGLVMGACSSGSGRDPLEDTSWELFAIRKSTPISGSNISATFKDGQVTGSAGCNTYFGSYEVNGDKISIGELAITEMACMEPEGIMEQELMIMEYLSLAQTFQLEDDLLMIFRPDGEALSFRPKG